MRGMIISSPTVTHQFPGSTWYRISKKTRWKSISPSDISRAIIIIVITSVSTAIIIQYISQKKFKSMVASHGLRAGDDLVTISYKDEKCNRCIDHFNLYPDILQQISKSTNDLYYVIQLYATKTKC